VFTDGGAPNSSQRRIVNEILAGRPPIPAAVVSNSALARGVITALSWFNPKIKAFAPDEVIDAYHYLGFTSSQIQVLTPRLAQLQSQMGAPIRAMKGALQGAPSLSLEHR
jgi:hypothetical protein